MEQTQLNTTPEQNSNIIPTSVVKQNNTLVIILSVLLLISLVITSYFAYQTQNLVKELNELKTTTPPPTESSLSNEEPTTTDSLVVDPTADWKKFESKEGVVLRYPSDWFVVNNMYISQKMFDAYSTERRTGVYNTIEIHKFTSKFVADKTNSSWFNDVVTGPEVVTEQGVKRTRIVKGEIRTGESYVLVRNQAGSVVDQIRAYLIKNEVIYEFVFSDYDEQGLETFKIIILNTSIV